jgi:DNA-binding NarL/FixJ family response regulator
MTTDHWEQAVRSLDRIAKILAGLLLRDLEDADQRLKIKRLKECGFENTEIAEMLSTTPNTVAVHSLKKGRKSRRSDKKKNARR